MGAAAARLLALLRAGLPQACALCAAPSGDALLCNGCAQQMPTIVDACPVCASPSPAGFTCGACLRAPPPFAASVAAWRYAFPADRLLHALKYGGRLALAEPCADALAHAIRRRAGPRADCICAVPLSPARQRSRGFNHAREIARRVARLTEVPLAGGLIRTRDGPPQAGLALAARSRNVRDAFAAAKRFDGMTVAIVDDVMTTGATLAAASTALRRAGAARVEAWVVARTPPARPG